MNILFKKLLPLKKEHIQTTSHHMDLMWIHQVIIKQHLDLSSLLDTLLDLDLVYI